MIEIKVSDPSEYEQMNELYMASKLFKSAMEKMNVTHAYLSVLSSGRTEIDIFKDENYSDNRFDVIRGVFDTDTVTVNKNTLERD